MTDTTNLSAEERRMLKLIDSQKVPRPEVPEVFDESLIVTAETALKRKQENERGFPYRLPVTGGFALLRPMNLFDRIVTKTLPQHIQMHLAEMLEKSNRSESKVDEIKNRQLTPQQRMMKALEENEEIADEICIRVFVNPRLARSDEHARQLHEQGIRNVMTVDMIDSRERGMIAAMIIGDSMIAEGAGAAKVAPFPGRPMGIVSTGPHVEAATFAGGDHRDEESGS